VAKLIRDFWQGVEVGKGKLQLINQKGMSPYV
jgi:hypothetical protein